MVLPFCSLTDLAVSKPVGSFIYPWHSEIPQIHALVWIHFIHFGEHSLDSFNLNLNVIQFWKIASKFIYLFILKAIIFNQQRMVVLFVCLFILTPIISFGNCIFIHPHPSWFDDLETLFGMMAVVAKLTLFSTLLYTQSILHVLFQILSLFSLQLIPNSISPTRPT